MSQAWWVYMIECCDGALYTGIAVDVEARFRAHLAGRGARYTRMNPPRQLLAARLFPDRGSAARAEYAIKQFRPEQKRQWAMENPLSADR